MSECVLLGIAVRAHSRAAMVRVESAEVTLEAGVVGDFRGKPGARQVTVLSREAWQSACQELGQALPWTTRRANLLIEGIELEGTIGAVIEIGDVRLEICGETDPCSRMDQQVDGLRNALRPGWRGGVCCRVIEGGTIQVGDRVKFVPSIS